MKTFIKKCMFDRPTHIDRMWNIYLCIFRTCPMCCQLGPLLAGTMDFQKTPMWVYKIFCAHTLVQNTDPKWKWQVSEFQIDCHTKIAMDNGVEIALITVMKYFRAAFCLVPVDISEEVVFTKVCVSYPNGLFILWHLSDCSLIHRYWNWKFLCANHF